MKKLTRTIAAVSALAMSVGALSACGGSNVNADKGHVYFLSMKVEQQDQFKELAEKTGLSIGYISQIERDLTDPSLSTLRKLSAALDIPTYLFMGGESSTSLTTRQADMLILSQPNSNVRYHLLTPMPNGNFVPQSLVIRFELEPHCKDGDLPVIHPSEEILLLEQGQLDVLVESETTRLNAGDTTVVQSNLPHIVSNPGDTTAVGLAVFTPAIWFPNNRRSFNRGGET